VFFPVERRRTRMFVHVLAGAGLVDGTARASATDFFHGWLTRPAYAFGGGVERNISRPFALRFGADYLHTSFYDSSGAIQGQQNFRATVSLVFRLSEMIGTGH